MNHQPTFPPAQTDVSLRPCAVPILMNDLGKTLFFLSASDHSHPANKYPRDSWVHDPDQQQSLVHVNLGYQSKIEAYGIMDGAPSTGLTSFQFCITYSACNGMRQTDGQEICEAVERLVERMVADRTWRREFGCREDETLQTEQPNGPVGDE